MLLDYIDKRVNAVNKFNIFVGSLNVVLAASLLIETLELLAA